MVTNDLDAAMIHFFYSEGVSWQPVHVQDNVQVELIRLFHPQAIVVASGKIQFLHYNKYNRYQASILLSLGRALRYKERWKASRLPSSISSFDFRWTENKSFVFPRAQWIFSHFKASCSLKFVHFCQIFDVFGTKFSLPTFAWNVTFFAWKFDIYNQDLTIFIRNLAIISTFSWNLTLFV